MNYNLPVFQTVGLCSNTNILTDPHTSSGPTLALLDVSYFRLLTSSPPQTQISISWTSDLLDGELERLRLAVASSGRYWCSAPPGPLQRRPPTVWVHSQRRDASSITAAQLRLSARYPSSHMLHSSIMPTHSHLSAAGLCAVIPR